MKPLLIAVVLVAPLSRAVARDVDSAIFKAEALDREEAAREKKALAEKNAGGSLDEIAQQRKFQLLGRTLSQMEQRARDVRQKLGEIKDAYDSCIVKGAASPDERAKCEARLISRAGTPLSKPGEPMPTNGDGYVRGGSLYEGVGGLYHLVRLFGQTPGIPMSNEQRDVINMDGETARLEGQSFDRMQMQTLFVADADAAALGEGVKLFNAAGNLNAAISRRVADDFYEARDILNKTNLHVSARHEHEADVSKSEAAAKAKAQEMAQFEKGLKDDAAKKLGQLYDAQAQGKGEAAVPQWKTAALDAINQAKVVAGENSKTYLQVNAGKKGTVMLEIAAGAQGDAQQKAALVDQVAQLVYDGHLPEAQTAAAVAAIRGKDVPAGDPADRDLLPKGQSKAGFLSRFLGPGTLIGGAAGCGAMGGEDLAAYKKRLDKTARKESALASAARHAVDARYQKQEQTIAAECSAKRAKIAANPLESSAQKDVKTAALEAECQRRFAELDKNKAADVAKETADHEAKRARYAAASGGAGEKFREGLAAFIPSIRTKYLENDLKQARSISPGKNFAENLNAAWVNRYFDEEWKAGQENVEGAPVRRHLDACINQKLLVISRGVKANETSVRACVDDHFKKWLKDEAARLKVPDVKKGQSNLAVPFP